MRRLALALALVALLPATASAGRIDAGEIVVNEGFNGATLGMTRAEVVGELGKPLDENPQGVLSYQPFNAASAGILDVYRGGPGRTVDLFVISFPKSDDWTLDDGNHIFKRGGIKRLFRAYGDRVRKRTDETLAKYYVVRGRFEGRPVETAFMVDEFKRRTAQVLDVFINYRS